MGISVILGHADSTLGRSLHALQVAAPREQGQTADSSALRVALVVALAHGLTDAYQSFVPPLLPRIMDDLGLSITLAATLAVTFSVAGALPQPLFGYLADRLGRRGFAVAGPLVAGVFVASIGFAPTFLVLVLLLTVGGLGSAAFHPSGASYAVRVSEGKGGGTRYSIFAFGGAFGFAVGPIAAVSLVQWRGMEGTWIAMIPVVLLAPLIYFGLPKTTPRTSRDVALLPRPGAVFTQLRGPLGLMFGISATMAYAQRTFMTMEPIIVADAGGSETLGAVALSVYLGAQSLGMVTGGLLADRMNRRTLLLQICLWALPAHLAAVWLGPESLVGLIAIAAAGFLALAALPPIVVMAQELMPTAAGVTSGIVMGLAWATGSLGVLGTGALADVIGPHPATLFSMPMIILAIGFALHPALSSVSYPPPDLT